MGQGMFRLDEGKNIFTERLAAQGSGEAPILEIFKKHVDVALRSIVC